MLPPPDAPPLESSPFPPFEPSDSIFPLFIILFPYIITVPPVPSFPFSPLYVLGLPPGFPAPPPLY